MTLQYLFAVRGAPEYLRSDNVPEFVAKEIQECLTRACVRTVYVQKENPWENGYVDSFNGKLLGELLNRELFLSLPEARVVLDQWRMDYNHRRPHDGLKWMTPAAFVAGLDDTAAGVVPAASRGVSPGGATAILRDTMRTVPKLADERLVQKAGEGVPLRSLRVGSLAGLTGSSKPLLRSSGSPCTTS